MKKYIHLLLLVLSFTAFAQEKHTDDIPYPFYVELLGKDNIMTPLHRGEEAFQMRLDMIRRAKTSIDVEYYMYNIDIAGKILTKELVKAAQRGVKVRLLLDKFMAVSEFNEFYAKEVAKYGIEVKYYNTALMIRLASIHYRNHRKLFIIDDKEAITGGRNIVDNEFNMNDKYNYEDRDVHVTGPIVQVMKDSFEAFYKDDISHFEKFPTRPKIKANPRGGAPDGFAERNRYDRLTKKVQEFFADTEEEMEMREKVAELANLQLGHTRSYVCPITSFVSDAPGAKLFQASKKSYREEQRFVRKAFLDKITPIDKALTISSPYFIANKRNRGLYEDLLKKNVEVNVYTNSLRSTDAIFMSANLYLHLKGWLKRGLNMYLSDAEWAEMSEHTLENAKKGKWGNHAKTHIYETSTYSEVMIGTYNIDNRSDYYNTELALFCKGNDEFTKDIKDDVMKIAYKGLDVQSGTKALDRNGNEINVTGSTAIKRLKMKLITLPSWLIDFLL